MLSTCGAYSCKLRNAVANIEGDQLNTHTYILYVGYDTIGYIDLWSANSSEHFLGIQN